MDAFDHRIMSDLPGVRRGDVHSLLHQKEQELRNLRETSIRDLEAKVSYLINLSQWTHM